MRYNPGTWLFTISAIGLCFGCGSADTPSSESPGPVSAETSGVSVPPLSPTDTGQPPETSSELPHVDLDLDASSEPPTVVMEDSTDDPPQRSSLADLLEQSGTDSAADSGGEPAFGTPANTYQLPIDDAQAAAAGIRKLAGEHLTLYTDVAANASVDELPAVFDAAVPLWAKYFDIDPARVQDWHMTGFLMSRKERFQGTGLLPPSLPAFQNGYQQGNYLWLYDQSEDYYRRHLLLHEGTHGFMALIVGGLGPPWYAEGMAELLGTHRWEEGRLELGYMPKSKDETPGWGRIRIVRDAIAAGQGKWPHDIMGYGPTAHLRTEPYGWCWALAAFLDKHPKYQTPFRQLKQMASQADLTVWLREQIGEGWNEFYEDWQIYIMNLDYGYDVARAAVVRKPGVPITAAGATATIVADRGWQSTGIELSAGTTYAIEATGRFQIAETTSVWWCEPGGVTIHYHEGKPIGLLLGAVRDEASVQNGQTPLIQPGVIGKGRQLTPQQTGTLYLKINEAASGLADNRGDVAVRLKPLAP